MTIDVESHEELRRAEVAAVYDEETYETTEAQVVPPSRVSWGAIVAGTVIALAVALVLGMLGAAIGLGTFDPAEEQNPLKGFGLGTGLWLALQIIVSLFVGGWVAGRLAGKPRSLDGILNGAVVWALAVLLSIFSFGMLASSIVSGVTSIVGKGVTAAAGAAGSVAQRAAPDVERSEVVSVIEQQALALLSETGKEQLQPGELRGEADALGQLAVGTAEDVANDPQNAQALISGAIDRAMGRMDGVVESADREALVNIVMARTDYSRPRAEAVVDNWIAQYQEAASDLRGAGSDVVGTVETVATDVSDALATAIWWSLLAIALGLLAACLGGWVGSLKLEQPQRHRRSYYSREVLA